MIFGSRTPAFFFVLFVVGILISRPDFGVFEPASAAPFLDHRELLEAQSFWDNRDFEWFENNIPFLDTPDAEINTTYYYRWELVSKHLTYGSPTTGYLWTEFINRPFWSGAYGGISCPSGHPLLVPHSGRAAAEVFGLDGGLRLGNSPRASE